MKITASAALVAVLSLCACNPGQGDKIVAKLDTVEQNTVTVGGAVFTKAAALACQGQSAANLAGKAAEALGKTDAAQGAATASAVLGLGCVWSAASKT